MTSDVVLLLVLLGAVVAAVVFTIVIVAVVDLSDAGTRPPNEDDGAREQEGEKR